MIVAMCKSDFAVKKISYGKPPVMLVNGEFYDLSIKSKCDIEGCGAQMHIEEYNGEFIAVCNADRSHLRRLDCRALNPNSKIAEENVENKEDISQQTQEAEGVANDGSDGRES